MVSTFDAFEGNIRASG